MSLDIAKALLEPEPSTTTLPTRSSIEVAEALLEVEGDSDGPESLTVISEVKKGAALVRYINIYSVNSSVSRFGKNNIVGVLPFGGPYYRCWAARQEENSKTNFHKNCLPNP